LRLAGGKIGDLEHTGCQQGIRIDNIRQTLNRRSLVSQDFENTHRDRCWSKTRDPFADFIM
jgi:hypothetical protein